MIYAIGADHRGFAHKEYIKKAITSLQWQDVGAYDDERSDYPLFAKKVCEHIASGTAHGGVLLCGSGIGMAIAANRYKKIYAGLAWTVEVAQQCKEDDAVNVLVIPCDYVSTEKAVAMIYAWHEAVFKGGRYQERIDMIEKLGGI